MISGVELIDEDVEAHHIRIVWKDWKNEVRAYVEGPYSKEFTTSNSYRRKVRCRIPFKSPRIGKITSEAKQLRDEIKLQIRSIAADEKIEELKEESR